MEVATTTKRPDLVEGPKGYKKQVEEYTKDLEQWQTRFFALYKRIEEIYWSLPREVKTWYVGAHKKLLEWKGTLIEQNPFPLEVVPT